MSKNAKLVMLPILFVSIFSSAFFIISYISNITIIANNQKLQLYIGLACLIVCVIIAIILIVAPVKNERVQENTKVKDKEISFMSIQPEEIKELIKEDSKQDISVNDSNVVSQQLNEQQNNNATTDIYENLNIENVCEDKNINDLFDEIQEESIEAINEYQHLQQMDEDDSEIISAEERIQSYNPQNDLSNTQINFINNSTNSYFDEDGRPQLNLTQTLSQQDLKVIDIQNAQIEQEGLNTVDKKSNNVITNEKIEDEYNTFKYDKYNSIISTIVVVLLILSLLSVGYLCLTVFMM